MYYNIKIISNGSEFSLNSNDKEITQNEMDKYFAEILDVSEEFRANLKKVVVKNKNVKSIELVDSQDTPAQDEKTPVNIPSQEDIEKIVEQKVQELARAKMLVTEPVVQETAPPPVQEIAPPPEEIATPIEEVTIPSEEITTPSEEVVTPTNQEIVENVIQNETKPSISTEETNSLPQTSQNDVDELILQAQEKFNSFNSRKDKEVQEEVKETPAEINSDKVEIAPETSSNEITNTDEVTLDTSESEQDKEEITQDLLNNIFNFNPDSLEENCNIEAEEIPEVKIEKTELTIEEKLDLDSTLNDEQELPVQIEEYIATDIVVPEFSNLAQQPIQAQEVQPIQPAVQQPEPTQPTVQEVQPIQIAQTENQQTKDDETIELTENPNIETDNDTCPSEDASLDNKDAIEIEQKTAIKTIEEIENPIEEEVQEKKKIELTMDFKEFLSNFACQDIYDEFIICAYHIKNALNLENFTMKFINSKLFQASGKIANLSIVDELIEREYIKVIETEDSKKYTITQSGEDYFINRFQG